MTRFIVQRALVMIVVLLGVLLFIFSISRLSGDPVPHILGDYYTQEQYDAMQEKLGLDKPVIVQFFNYVKGIVTKFDLGISFYTKRAVTTELAVRLPVSIRIAFITIAWCVPIGIILGLVSAIKQYSIADYTLSTSAMILASTPNFFAALMFMLLFSVVLKWLPATGLMSWKHYVMPCLTLGLRPVASYTRMTRSSMLEVIRQDYIRTARSKGLSQRRVILVHALQNAAIPIVTMFASTVEHMIGGTSVVENIFGIPGMGSFMISSIRAGDYPSVQGAVLVFSLIVCICNLTVDILYAVIDPRIKSSYKSYSSWAQTRQDRKIIKAVTRG